MPVQCHQCRQTVEPRVDHVSHGLHALGTLLTCGLWSVIWLGAWAATALNPSCPACGVAL